MPIISRFYGIAIYMHWRDHAPPHFHAKYQDEEITMEIVSGAVTGTMARRALAIIDEWRLLHAGELQENWQPAEKMQAMKAIAPLEQEGMAILHVSDARHVRDYVLWARFDNGVEGEVNLETELEGEVFGPLRDLDKFKRFRVDTEMRTIVWENGADLAPEFLYENLRMLAQ